MEYPIITDKDLMNNEFKYNINIIEYNYKLGNLDKKILIYTQKLTTEFCVKYLYNMNINSGSEDSYLWDADYILERQPNITENELLNEIKLQNK